MIKIEKPGSGDDARAWAPPSLKDADGSDTTESAYYLGRNRGKLSAAIARLAARNVVQIRPR